MNAHKTAIAALATCSALLVIFGTLQFAFLGLVQAIAICILIER